MVDYYADISTIASRCGGQASHTEAICPHLLICRTHHTGLRCLGELSFWTNNRVAWA